MLSTQLHIACCMHSACRPCSSDLPQASTHHPDTAKPVFRRLQRLQFSRHRCSRWKTYAPPPACGAGGAPRQRRLPLPAIPGKYQASALPPFLHTDPRGTFSRSAAFSAVRRSISSAAAVFTSSKQSLFPTTGHFSHGTPNLQHRSACTISLSVIYLPFLQEPFVPAKRHPPSTSASRPRRFLQSAYLRPFSRAVCAHRASCQTPGHTRL